MGGTVRMLLEFAETHYCGGKAMFYPEPPDGDGCQLVTIKCFNCGGGELCQFFNVNKNGDLWRVLNYLVREWNSGFRR
jgi:hypothetical protein